MPNNIQEIKFCNTAYLHQMVILPSFHRCGNTLTRELLEGITHILTGSDDNHTNNVVKTEAFLEFKGQWVIDQSIWVYKTHYPARKGKGTFYFDKILLVVRNPFDALESMFNLYLTNSHSKSIKTEEYTNLFQDWEGLVKEELLIWNSFYEFWISYAESKELSKQIYIVRYEDLIENIKDQITKIISFLLEYKNFEDTIVEKNIDEYLQNRKLIYKPRKGTNYHSLEHYTNDQIKFILENSIKMFCFFEYDKIFQELIDKFSLGDAYKNYINKHSWGGNKYFRTFKDLNGINLEDCNDDKYPFDYIHIPNRINQLCEWTVLRIY